MTTAKNAPRTRQARDTLDQLENTIAALSEQAARLKADLEPPRAVARGTGDVTAQARAAARTPPPARRSATEYGVDGVPPAELNARVEALISERPMTAPEIAVAAGVRENRVRGVLVRFSRLHAGRLLKLNGGAGPARWLLAQHVTRITKPRSKA